MTNYDLISDELEDQIFKEVIENFIAKQKDIEPEIQEAVNEIFWDLI